MAATGRKRGWGSSASEPDEEPREATARRLGVWPLDQHNQRLLDLVRPFSWSDPPPLEQYDLLVLGAGAGGLVSAKQSARRGASVAFISEHLAGGDCLNVGCVPSKALLRSARALREVRRAADFGVRFPGGTDAKIEIDFAAVMERMRRLRADIAPADSHESTAATGAHVFQGRGRFVSHNKVKVNGTELCFKKAIIATGGRAAVPPLEGLDRIPYLTNETIFNLTSLPPRMVVLGSGAVGLEMAQCFAVFGSKVIVISRSSRLLPRSSERASAALQAALERDGVKFIFHATAKEVFLTKQGGADGFPIIHVEYTHGEALTKIESRIECDALLVAVGRAPNVEDVGLENAGIAYSNETGITVNSLLTTTNPNVYAVGDCVAGAPRLTHMSGEMAKVAVQNALFGDSWSLNYHHVPRCIYTEPELALVGMDEKDVAESGKEVRFHESDLAHNDRVILDGDSAEGGIVSILTEEDGTILGATIFATRAGEMVNEVTLAMQGKLSVEALARLVHAYPTVGEGVMQAALGFVRSRWARMN